MPLSIKRISGRTRSIGANILRKNQEYLNPVVHIGDSAVHLTKNIKVSKLVNFIFKSVDRMSPHLEKYPKLHKFMLKTSESLLRKLSKFEA